MLSAALPIIHQHLAYPNLASERRVAVGDLDVRARVFLYRDRALSPRHLLASIVGLELPTAPLLAPSIGRATMDFQAGSGSFDPIVGIAYSGFFGDWSTQLVSVLTMRTRGHLETRDGPSWSSSATLQWQPMTTLGLQASFATRLDAQATVAGAADRFRRVHRVRGRGDPDSRSCVSPQRQRSRRSSPRGFTSRRAVLKIRASPEHQSCADGCVCVTKSMQCIFEERRWRQGAWLWRSGVARILRTARRRGSHLGGHR